MAYQFIHLEAYSRKGRNGRGTAFVFDEASRVATACQHVGRPAPPEVVYGLSVEAARALHDERAVAARTTLGNGKLRSIRKDQNTLLTVVASHPATMDDVRAHPTSAADVRVWECRTIAWLQSQYGKGLVSVVRHVDEKHPHLHAFVLPQDPEMRASRLHPGAEAKRSAIEASSTTQEDRKALNRNGDRAYCRAMREWQDSYWRAVGLKSGLTRVGPGRRRLTRAEWHAEKAAIKASKEALAEAQRTTGAARAVARKAAEESRVLVASARASHLAAKLREEKAAEILRSARSARETMISETARDAARLRSWGSRLRSLWDGLRSSAIWAAARRDADGQIAAARHNAERLAERVQHERSERRAAEARADAAAASARAAGQERDFARRRLSALVRVEGPELNRANAFNGRYS